MTHRDQPPTISFASLLSKKFTEHAKTTTVDIDSLWLDLMLFSDPAKGISKICNPSNQRSPALDHFEVESSKIFSDFEIKVRDRRTGNLLVVKAEKLHTGSR